MASSILLAAIAAKRQESWVEELLGYEVDVEGLKFKLLSKKTAAADKIDADKQKDFDKKKAMQEAAQILENASTRRFTEACEEIGDLAFSNDELVFRRQAFHDAKLSSLIVAFASEYLDEKVHNNVDYIAESYVCDVICKAFFNMSVFYAKQNARLNREIFDETVHCDKSEGFTQQLFESGAGPVIIKILAKHFDNIEVANSVCGTIANIAFDNCNDFKRYFGQSGSDSSSCEFLVKALRCHMKIQYTVDRILSAIWALSDSIDNSIAFGQAGACEILIEVMCRYFTQYDIMRIVVLAVGLLANGNQDNQLKLGQSSCCELLKAALDRYIEYDTISIHACNSILALAPCERNKNTFNDIRVLDSMRNAMNRYPSEIHHPYHQTLAILRYQNILEDPNTYNSGKIPPTKTRDKA